MTEHDAATISRRSFLLGGALTVGSLFLPRVPGSEGEFVVPFSPEDAWADELGAEGKIMVVGRKQIGIAVGDIGTLDQDAQTIRALSDATVTIHSLYNHKEVTGVTDAAGRAVFDIDALAEAVSVDSADPTDSNGKKLEYCFNGMITVTREGYRDVVIPLMRIRSVTAIVIPTRVLKPGKPYLRQLSFDRWDIQYNNATLVSSSDNDTDHEFAAEVWVPATKTVSLRLYATGEDEDGGTSTKEIGTATFRGAGSDGRQKASFKARYLCPSWPREVLPVGCKVVAELACDGTTQTVTSGLEIKEAPFVDEEDGEIDVVPEAKGTAGVRLATLPSGLPKPLGGSSFKLWTPSFGNVMYNFSPLGYLMIGLQLGSLKLTKDAGPFEEGGWKRQTKESAGEQFNKLCKKQQKDIEDVGKMYTDEKTGRRKYFASDCSKEVSVKGCFQVYAQLAYDWDTAVWSGDLNAVLGGGVEACWTIQMVIVIVPVYISFDLGAQVTAGLKFAARSHGSNLDKLLENAVYDADSSGAGFTLTISVGLTLGVGVADVLCAYVRGEGYITMAIAYQNGSDRDRARLRLGVGLEASLGVQVLLFSWSGKLWSQDWPGLYDSYDEANDAVDMLAANGALPLDANGIPQFTAADMAEKMEIVEDYILYNRAEFSAKASTVALFANEEPQPAYVEPEDLGDGNLLWDVPPQAQLEVDEDGEPILGAPSEGHFDYLDESNTNETLPNRDDPTASDSLRVGIADVSDGVSGGIRPSVDTTIFKNVFSDPRTKTVYSTMFRIATVRYGSEARTRVVYTTQGDKNWNNPQVIEFDPVFSSGAEPVSRMDMYDYDFAVTRLNGLFGDYLYLMVISGTRPQGDETTFVEANSKTVVSVVRLYNSYSEVSPWRCDRAICWSPNVGSNMIASFSSPVIGAFADYAHFDRETNSCVIGACLVAVARKTRPQDLVTNGASRLLTFHIEHRGMNEFLVLTNSSFDRLAYSGTTKLVMGPVTPDQPLDSGNYDRVNRHVYLGAVGSRGAQTYRVQVNYSGTVGTIYTRFAAGLQAEGAYAQRLYPSGNDAEFYAICTDKSLFQKSAEDGADVSYRRDGRLYLMRIDGDSATYTPITPEGTCVPSELLVSKDGRYLFYLVNKEGKSSRGFTPEGEVGPQRPASQAKPGDSYRVMALARVGNLFTKPFTLAVLDRPIDYMTSMMSWGSTATLIGTEITDFSTSRANIRDIRIPLAAVGTPLSVATEGPFAFAGEDTVFDVEVRNDGNTILRGATFSLHEVTVNEDGSETVNPVPACTSTLDFQPDLVTYAEGEESSAPTYDLDLLSEEFAASPLASAGELGLLVPGQVQSYKVTFHIPASWASSSAAGGDTSSERKVRLKITNPQYLDFNAETQALLAADGDGEDAGGAGFDTSNGDFEDITPEEWKQFFNFLQLLEALYEEDDTDDWPETQVSVLDGGLPVQNLANLHDGEASTSGGSGSGSGSGTEPGGGSGGEKGDGPGGSATPKLPDTGDDSLLGRLMRR